MLKCPKCGSKIPFYKPWFLTNFNHITCSKCGEKLYANRIISTTIGGIGSLTGVAIGYYINKFDLWEWMVIILWFLCILLATSIFTKFENKE